MELNIIQKICAYALPIIFAITVHEAAHGYAARYFGDMTAHYLKRITLNPFKHIDLMGTILLPALTVMLGGILFGWAKPVPVNFSNLRNPKKDMMWVALAGHLFDAIDKNAQFVSEESKTVDQTIMLVQSLLETAAEEYAIGIVDGDVKNKYEYQDALGFTMIAKDILNKMQVDDKSDKQKILRLLLTQTRQNHFHCHQQQPSN